MSEASSTFVSISLKTDTSCSEVMDVSGLLNGREYGDVSETWHWTASSSSEIFMDVSVLCMYTIVDYGDVLCILNTLANSLNNVKT